MKISDFFKISSIVILLCVFVACGSSGSSKDDDDGDGNTQAPNISLSESTYDFAGIAAGSTAERTFTVTNNGNADLIIGAISSPEAPFSVSDDTCSNATLEASGNCSLNVSFSPTSGGDFNETISIPSNDSDGDATITLNGEGYVPNISLSLSSFAFATTDVFETASRTFVVTNNGHADLIIGAISSPEAPFGISADSCSNATLEATDTCSFTATFSPTTEDEFTGSLSIPSNDPDQATATVALSGASQAPNISVESNYDFGSIVIDNSVDHTFNITNNGKTSLYIGAISGPSLPFSIADDQCSNSVLAVSENCSLTASFSPTVQGAGQLGSFSFPTNDPDLTTATINLTGEGYGLNVWIKNVEVAGCVVTAYLTVTDVASNAFLTGLTADDFTLNYQSGSANDGVPTVINTSPTPVSVALAIDWSPSTSGILDTIQEAANGFISTLTPGSDELAVFKFNGVIGNEPAAGLLSADFTDATDFINDDTFGYTTGTLYYDALYDSIERLVISGTKDKKAVVVLSDGVNFDPLTPVPYTSEHDLEDVISYANANGIPIFSIFSYDPNYGDGEYGDSEGMQRLAEETGGQAYSYLATDPDPEKLNNIYQEISNVLTNEYTITFTSTICDGTVTLDIGAESGGLYGKDSTEVTF